MRQWQHWGVKLQGQGGPRISNIFKEASLDGMVKLIELPLTHRHARKSESF
jgi:hypothetical protein